MMQVFIIDKTDQIKSALSPVTAMVESFDDEVKALNAMEGRPSPIILLSRNIMQERTAEYVSLLLKSNVNSKIIVIAKELSDEGVLGCLLAGAKGFQQLEQLSEYAERLVTVIDAGEAWITRRMTATLIDSLRQS